MIVSVKKRKMKMLDTLLKENLDKIAKIEDIPVEESKEGLIDKLATKLNLKKVRNYVKKLSVSEAFDIFEHDLVPRHRIVSQEEKEALLKKYYVSEKQLPRISITDPAVLTIGGKLRDVVEITRKSPTSGEAKYYRIVVKSREK